MEQKLYIYMYVSTTDEFNYRMPLIIIPQVGLGFDLNFVYFKRQ